MAAYKECVPTMLTFASKQKRYDNCVRMCKNMIKRPPFKHLDCHEECVHILHSPW